MRTSGVIGALALWLAAAAPVTAATVWTVDGSFTPLQPAAPGAPVGRLFGTFTTEDRNGGLDVIAINLRTTASEAFQDFAYDNVAAIVWDALPQYFTINVPLPGGGSHELQLFFEPMLEPGQPGVGRPGAFAFRGYEHQEFQGSGNRMLTGVATPGVVGGVPEPAAWALMIVGLGVVGASLRRRGVLAPT